MKVLVVGSRGYLGGHLMDTLRSQGVEAVGISSSDGESIDPVSGSVRPEFKVPDETDVVVYLSQSPYSNQGVEGAVHALSVNTVSAVAMASLAIKAGARRFIFISTGTVYKDSFSPLKEDDELRRDSWYTLTKVCAEESLALMRSEIEVIVVRPFAIYGPFQEGRLIPRMLSTVRSGGDISILPRRGDSGEDGGLRISLCHVEDVASALSHLCLNGGGECLNLAGSEALSIREIATCIGKAVGIDPCFKVTEGFRKTDLIANTELLETLVPVRFRSFSEGVETLL